MFFKQKSLFCVGFSDSTGLGQSIQMESGPPRKLNIRDEWIKGRLEVNVDVTAADEVGPSPRSTTTT